MAGLSATSGAVAAANGAGDMDASMVAAGITENSGTTAGEPAPTATFYYYITRHAADRVMAGAEMYAVVSTSVAPACFLRHKDHG